MTWQGSRTWVFIFLLLYVAASTNTNVRRRPGLTVSVILFESNRTISDRDDRQAMRIAKEMIVGLRYKLRMFGVPIDGPANVYCDNQGVVKNTSLPESTLAKKHNAINYEFPFVSGKGTD